MQSRRRFLSQSMLLAALAASPGAGFAERRGGGRKRVILDVDLGIDDAVALLFAHYSPAIDLVGITTVFGNTSLEKGTRNSPTSRQFGIAGNAGAGAAALYRPPPRLPTFVRLYGLRRAAHRSSIEASRLSAPEFIARPFSTTRRDHRISVGPSRT
jgi:inosine-uridine nucleoside N-ribohydrolase